MENHLHPDGLPPGLVNLAPLKWLGNARGLKLEPLLVEFARSGFRVVWITGVAMVNLDDFQRFLEVKYRDAPSGVPVDPEEQRRKELAETLNRITHETQSPAPKPNGDTAPSTPAKPKRKGRASPPRGEER